MTNISYQFLLDGYLGSDISVILPNYDNQINKLEQDILELEKNNINIVKNIYSLDKLLKIKNIKHSNTINFMILNYTQLNHTLYRLIKLYNINIYSIYVKQQEIYYLQQCF
jgi:hypothetical protein